MDEQFKITCFLFALHTSRILPVEQEILHQGEFCDLNDLQDNFVIQKEGLGLHGEPGGDPFDISMDILVLQLM